MWQVLKTLPTFEHITPIEDDWQWVVQYFVPAADPIADADHGQLEDGDENEDDEEWVRIFEV